jgi:hypothetical protein
MIFEKLNISRKSFVYNKMKISNVVNSQEKDVPIEQWFEYVEIVNDSKFMESLKGLYMFGSKDGSVVDTSALNGRLRGPQKDDDDVIFPDMVIPAKSVVRVYSGKAAHIESEKFEGLSFVHSTNFLWADSGEELTLAREVIHHSIVSTYEYGYIPEDVLEEGAGFGSLFS